MNRNYNATENLNNILEQIKNVQRNGLKVKISGNKISVENTVRSQYDRDQGIDIMYDEIAYAEYAFPSED